MTCRHTPGDPDCSSHSNWLRQEKRNKDADRVEDVEKEIAELLARTPNPEIYTIINVEEIGLSLVMKVQYTSCEKCSFDSMKVLVFEDTNLKNAIHWKRIDPHFSEETPKDRTIARAPIARFPASDRGWNLAIAFAESILD